MFLPLAAFWCGRPGRHLGLAGRWFVDRLKQISGGNGQSAETDRHQEEGEPASEDLVGAARHFLLTEMVGEYTLRS
jgi:hypothetical protein